MAQHSAATTLFGAYQPRRAEKAYATHVLTLMGMHALFTRDERQVDRRTLRHQSESKP
jgi:hypothetical protein